MFFLTLCLIYGMVQELGNLQRNQEKSEWMNQPVQELRGCVVGVLGMGSIGNATAQKAAALGMRVHGFRRQRQQYEEGDVVMHYGKEGLQELLAVSDYVVCTLPCTPSTEGLLGVEELAAMKSDAVLINVGRGEVVNDGALVKALQQQTIRGAALEVFKVEPLPSDHAYWTMKNVLVAPHCADNTKDQDADALNVWLKNLKAFSTGLPLNCVVDRNQGY